MVQNADAEGRLVVWTSVIDDRIGTHSATAPLLAELLKCPTSTEKVAMFTQLRIHPNHIW